MSPLEFLTFFFCNALVCVSLLIALQVAQAPGMILSWYAEMMDYYSEKYIIADIIYHVTGLCGYCTIFWISVFYCYVVIGIPIYEFPVAFLQGASSMGILYVLLVNGIIPGDNED